MKKIKLYKYLILTLSFLLWIPFAQAGNIDSVLKYAWGDKMSWINFNPDGGNVTLSDDKLTGKAWSYNYGWINLNPDNSGVKNDGQGKLSGFAWSENLGWIDFSGVEIRDGIFSGQASGSETGIINFSCDHCLVKTDWRKAASASGPAIIPIYPQSANISLPLINNDLIITSDKTEVEIPLVAGPEVKSLSISLNPDFNQAGIIPFQNNVLFNFCPNGGCESGTYYIWIKFFSQTGHSSEIRKIVINYQKPDNNNNNCIDNRIEFLKAERLRQTTIDTSLTRRLTGMILLQTEDLGRAWYLYPKDLKRYYLGCPQDAFAIMRKLSLGISNNDFENLTMKVKKKLAGIILLKVEDKGRAYFINPEDLQLYYLGRPNDAFKIMRDLSLGISNNNLSRLKIED